MHMGANNRQMQVENGSFVVLLSPCSCFDPQVCAKKKSKKSSTMSTKSSPNRQPPLHKKPTPPLPPQPIRKVRPHLLPLVRFTLCGCHLLPNLASRMLHQTRHRPRQPPALPHRKIPLLQLLKHGLLPLRRPLAQPPPHHHHRRPLDVAPQLLL